ncbi:alpha/beta fold hydrolase [Methylococcus sp. EFPC2]|uniref:alpha/beta fold hydrolase n=1 Tax=Methylococcus sp. EFPC2 TaxID=2812648 RepID=UPI0019670CC3|nr:alpha/beta hydrolase [Methylococcus sp. EFPC2]QSA98453.1 alpha/beta hydrolase [Methylococcus sp. EFPC2]
MDAYLQVAPAVRIRYCIDHPQQEPSGSVLLLQGRAETVEKYEEIIAGLTARGLSVYSFDWRGQGLSDRLLPDRLKGHVASFEDYLSDLRRFVHELWQPQGPHYLIAHSMGGHLALRYCAEWGFRPDGALLCAPMIDLQTRRWPRHVAPLIVGGMLGLGLADSYIPGARPYLPTAREFQGNPLTSDRVRFERFPDLARRRPELLVGGPTFGWVKAAFDSIEVLERPGYVEGIDCPVHILVGDGDLIVDLEAARRISRRLPRGRFTILENARHEIMLEGDTVLDRFWSALDALTGGPDHSSPII